MSRSTLRLDIMIALVAVALVAVFAIAGCLSCHGGSYEALAERTADLGDWNPHDSLHGGYNACVNCHEKDKEITFNYCENCHVYAPDEEVLY